MPNSTEPTKNVTIVIPNWNGMRWVDKCLRSLCGQTMQEFVVIVVDNASTDGSTEFIRRVYPDCQVVELDSNKGFAGAANIGIRLATTPYIVLLNNDTEAFPDWLANLVVCIDMAPADVVAINSQMLRMDDPELIDDAGDELSWFGSATKRGHGQLASYFEETSEVFSPCAGASLYRRDFLLAVGGFDPLFFAYLEDVDLGLRGRVMGYRYVYQPMAKILHHGHGTNLPQDHYIEWTTRNRLLLFAKNVPLFLIVKHIGKLLYGQVYFLLAYARPWASIRGYLHFFISIPSALRQRRKIMSCTKIDLSELDMLIHSIPPYPSLSKLFLSRWGSVVCKMRLLFASAGRG